MPEQQKEKPANNQQEKRNSTGRSPNTSMKNRCRLYELQQPQLLQLLEKHQTMGLCLFA